MFFWQIFYILLCVEHSLHCIKDHSFERCNDICKKQYYSLFSRVEVLSVCSLNQLHGNLLGIQIIRPHPTSAKSEDLGVRPSNLDFKKTIQVILKHAEV